MNKNVINLERTYFIVLGAISILIPLTPVIIKDGISLLREEFVEMVLIGLLIALGYVIMLVYNNEIHRRQKQLDEAFRYIGEVNVRLQHIQSFFSDIKKYPEDKKDFKNILEFVTDKILGIASADWVMVRIVDTSSGSTLRERITARGGAAVLHHAISNEILLSRKNGAGYSFVAATAENVSFQAFCIFPKSNVKPDEEILIKAVLNQLQMLFLIFTSQYYKKPELPVRT